MLNFDSSDNCQPRCEKNKRYCTCLLLEYKWRVHKLKKLAAETMSTFVLARRCTLLCYYNFIFSSVFWMKLCCTDNFVAKRDAPCVWKVLFCPIPVLLISCHFPWSFHLFFRCWNTFRCFFVCFARVFSSSDGRVFLFILHHSSHNCKIAKHFTIISVTKTDVFVWLISDAVI